MKSQGPGGQNVNKVNSKAELRLDLERATWIHPIVKDSLVKKNHTKINQDGQLIIATDMHRSQHQNRAECLKKLENMLLQAVSDAGTPISKETHKKIQSRYVYYSKHHL